jgi:hypothetical protein
MNVISCINLFSTYVAGHFESLLIFFLKHHDSHTSNLLDFILENTINAKSALIIVFPNTVNNWC